MDVIQNIWMSLATLGVLFFFIFVTHDKCPLMAEGGRKEVGFSSIKTSYAVFSAREQSRTRIRFE